MNFEDNNELQKFRERILEVLNPIKPASKDTIADKQFLFSAQRTDAGRQLPAYFLVYFLFVDLLQFKNLGQFEKVAWSVPIDFNGRGFLIEHRKFGVGVFAHDAEKENTEAELIVKKIKHAIKIATPYFEFLAARAAKDSKLNVKNNSRELFERYTYFSDLFFSVSEEAKRRKDERIVKRNEFKGGYSETITFPARKLRKNSEWLALAAIDSFFSWTEHVFIHLAVFRGRLCNGEEIADMAEQDWQSKFKKAIDLNTPELKKLYDELTIIKRQLRNYIAHGAFGKRGEAFSFHSGAGAVPLLLPHQKGKPRFSFSSDLGFNEIEAMQTIKNFIDVIWQNEREPAKLYIQESELPTILTYAANGTYRTAMGSTDEMKELVDHLLYEWDRSANMDF